MEKGLFFLPALVFFLVVSISLVSADACPSIDATTTQNFIDEIMSREDCEVQLPSPLHRFFSDEEINLVIARKDGSTTNLLITIVDGQITSLGGGYSENPTYVITVEECSLDTLLRNNFDMGTVAYMFNNGKINIGAHGFWNSIKWFGTKLVVGQLLKSQEVETEILCDGQRGPVGAVCNHGGECETGNCIYIGGEGPDRTYKCSCDPFRYDPYVDSEGNCPNVPEYPEDDSGKAGALCQHGGQCESGNCIGIVPGQVYKCSCDPYRFVGGDQNGDC
jgi:hypothetical protein